MRRRAARSVVSAGKLHPFVIRLLLLALMASSRVLAAQNVGSRSFEVATVKPMDQKNPHPPSVNIAGDQFKASGMTLRELIKIAYDLNYGADQQIAGGPPWIQSERFDLEAKEDGALSVELHQLSEQQRGDQLRQMLRDLLAERFKLKIHRESKKLPVYLLSPSRSGAKLVPSAPGPAPDAPGTPNQKNWIRIAGKGVLEGNGADIPMIVTVLSMQPEVGGRLVLDKTGLKGNYNFTLKWSPETSQSTDSPADGGPALFTALQEELGLKLQSAKAPVEMIVIDHVEMPSAN